MRELHAASLLLLLFCATSYADDVLAPGDIDGDGVGELIRIDHEGGAHVVGTDGTRRYSFQMFEPAVSPPGGVTPMPTPVTSQGAVLPDMNTNGSMEIVVTGLDRYARAIFDGRSQGLDCEVWDPMTQTRLWHAKDCGSRPTVIPDQNRNDARDLAFQNHWYIEMFDGASGAPLFSNRIRYPAADLVATWRGVGILGDRFGDLRDVIQLRDPATEQVTQNIWLGGRSDEGLHQAQLIRDLNGNRSWEWAILKTRFPNYRKVEVNFRDSRTGDWLYTVDFFPWSEPLHMMIVNGDEVAVVSRFSGGAQPLEVRSARTGALEQRVWFPKTLTIESVTRTPDINGNGSNEVAVIGEQWGKLVSIIRDTATGQWLRRIVWRD